MGTIRTVDLPPGPNGEEQTAEITNLEWALQFVKLKVQEMVCNLLCSAQIHPHHFGRYSMDEKQTNVASSYLDLKVHLMSLSQNLLSHIHFTDTNNIINEQNGGYDHVSEYIPIGQPNAGTLAQIDALQPSSTCGDRMFTISAVCVVTELRGLLYSYRRFDCRH